MTDHHYALLEDSCANPAKVYTADDLLPAALTEANSIDCGGVPGVSNTFASALWALDYSCSTECSRSDCWAPATSSA